MQDIRYNADFNQRVVIRPEDYQWVDSPMPGVERMMLDRIGGEVARATSIVRYAPNSQFSPHEHSGGEEYLVLEGTFADEHGQYPVGTYARNPIGTAHTPVIGDDGATIFVKLHQFDANDSAHFTTATDIKNDSQKWLPGPTTGIEQLELHRYESEHVCLQRWQANTHMQSHQHDGGQEILVLQGTLLDEHGEYTKGTWIRMGHLSTHEPFTRSDGALIYVKSGHLPKA